MARIYNIVVFLFVLLSVASAYSPRRPSPASQPLVSRAVPTSWSLPPRVAAEPGTITGGNLTSAKERWSQYNFQWCPEFFHNPPKLCSQCGGDSKVKGRCDNILLSGPQGSYHCRGACGYYCKCSDNGGPDNSPKVTSTTVIDGQTGTAIWEPITLTEYRGLQASTTVTLMETATATAGSEVESVVAVIFAGGVAWWLATQSGAGAAALALQPPTVRPEGSEEDSPSCKKDPKEECPNCGGGDGLGLCKSGRETGCPCDEKQECPESPPQCSAPECGGDSDGASKCTNQGSGLGGCTCCPAKQPVCTTTDCEGDENHKCKEPLYQGCTCDLPTDDADVEFDPNPPALPKLSAQSSAAADVFTRIWGADYNKVPGYPAPTTTSIPSPYCLHGAAPNQPRVPKEYCQCGANHATFYSVATGTNPCPWNPTSTGQLVTFSTPTPTSSSSPPPAYATGSCCFHVDEYQNCNPMANNLYANITVVDNNKNIIYQTSQNFPNSKPGYSIRGDPINDNDPLTIQGPLPSPLRVTGEHENDYIQFSYGSLSWTSRDSQCNTGGWDPRDGPACSGIELLLPPPPAKNQMDCCFPC